MQFQATRCNDEDVLAGNDDPALPLVACSTTAPRSTCSTSDHRRRGDRDATSGFDRSSARYEVDLQFKSTAADTWADFTAANIGKQAAFTLDSKVVSAPVDPGRHSRAAAPRSPATSPRRRATELANTLKYGSLPLSFEASEAETVSATLGLASLQAGLIAGAIGLVLVLIYCLLYYRVLGLLTALSLIASGAMVYAILVLLGRYIGYTLDLAGIAGLIIGIGMTADSFVVFFERIKDEIREGRIVPLGGAARLGACPQDDPVRQRGQLHRRRGALRPGGRPGARASRSRSA